jgi:hypothetical protein
MDTCSFKASTSDSLSASFALSSSASLAAAPVLEAVEGRAACLATVEAPGDPVTVDSRFFASVPILVLLVLGLAARAVVVVVVRGAVLLAAVTGFLRVDVVDPVVGLVVVLDGDEASPLGTTEVRRAADVIVDLFLSSSSADWRVPEIVVEVVLAGFLRTVVVGGRVGGLLRVLPVRAALFVVVLAVVVVAPGRRTVDVAVPGRFVATEPAVLVDDAGDFASDLGDVRVTSSTLAVSVAASVPASVPASVVSSLERMDSSCWRVSVPSVSDMVATSEASQRQQDRFALAATGDSGVGNNTNCQSSRLSKFFFLSRPWYCGMPAIGAVALTIKGRD